MRGYNMTEPTTAILLEQVFVMRTEITDDYNRMNKKFVYERNRFEMSMVKKV